MSNQVQNLDSVESKLKSLMKKKSKHQIISLLISLRKDPVYKTLSKWNVFDVIGKTLKIDPIYFMKIIYPSFRTKLQDVFEKHELVAMEIYLLENISFLKDEILRFKCGGRFIINVDKGGSKIVLKDANIYLSNIRMIVHSNGIKVSAKDSLIYSHFKNEYLTRYYVDMILSRNYYHSKPCYGYEFPIIDLSNIKKTNTKLEYTYYQGGKTLYCEIIPNFSFNVKGLEKMLNEINSGDFSNNNLFRQCKNCGKVIKIKNEFCKHCGRKNRP